MLLKTTMATAPAASALATLSAKKQSPREIKAIEPVIEPAGKAVHPSGSPTSPA